MALFFRKIFLVALLPLLLAACGGDWTAGSPDADGALFNRSFRYYYVMDCRYDSFGLYDCSYEEPVSPNVLRELGHLAYRDARIACASSDFFDLFHNLEVLIG